MSIFIQLKRWAGPIRHFKQISPTIFMYIMETPGFTKDLLTFEKTHNGLLMIDGHMILKENEQIIYKKSVHEAILLPTDVIHESIQWDTSNGITTVICNKNK